ncbi:nitrile hydratase subunit beta [Gymnodinialimonas sp. 2305UL16-5]|uniref:nitrile hydratase subunit beta n=1 Tax=Gymnodinialimonas mytili TaxID=3126503 RepID=UPI00309928A7
MSGGADLGGMGGFGPIISEENEPNFHAPWEARVLGMIVALGASGQWNLDQSRSARESLPPGDYLTFSYYKIWLEAAIDLMQSRGMITKDELSDGKSRIAPIPIARVLSAADVPAALAKGGPVDRPTETEPAFAVGQRVHTINDFPETHTRLPRYARDKTGIVTAIHGFHVYPDSNARGDGEDPKWLYQVRFEATDLWGNRASSGDGVTLDLWEPYLRLES